MINLTPSSSEIRLTEKGYALYFNDEPFYIKGAGLGNADIKHLALTGANALRTWNADNGKAILDEAHKYGLKVMMGIRVGLERHGFDYHNEYLVGQQLSQIRQVVLKLKDHPALLLWGIGNELNHESTNAMVWKAVNDISKLIHTVDTNHVTTTSLAGFDEKYVKLITREAPDLDVLSLQLYAGIEDLPHLIKTSKYSGPLLITEWGTTGYWEVDKTSWGAPLETNSTVKANNYLNRYLNVIMPLKHILVGSFVFLWGQKQERTPTWFGMFMLDGSATEVVDVMHYLWKGKWPDQRCPRIIDFTLNDKHAKDDLKLLPEENCKALMNLDCKETANFEYTWEIMEETKTDKTGGDPEYIPQIVPTSFENSTNGTIRFMAPKREGAYRLFVSVKSKYHRSAHANIPFYVK